MISYKYNIYRSKNTKWLDKMLGECCFVWNHALALQRRYYRLFGKYVGCNKLKGYFAKRIKRFLLHSHTRQEIIERLDIAYQRFFKKSSKRPPKFRRKEDFSSFVFKGSGGYVLDGNHFIIRRINRVFKFSFSRPYQGKVKRVIIKRLNRHRYSLYIVTDYNPQNTYGKTHNGASVGVDFGLKTYLTMSDGITYQSPRFFKELEPKIKKACRKLSKAKKDSNNRKRRKFELQQLYIKVSNLRDDYQWKLAHELCQKYDYIFVETLGFSGMIKIWGKKVLDLAHASFLQKLKHIAAKYGVVVHEIDKWFPSSRLCECGFKNESLSLKDRKWVCPNCGSVNDRDFLASKNILRRGIYELESGSKTPLGAYHVCIQESPV